MAVYNNAVRSVLMLAAGLAIAAVPEATTPVAARAAQAAAPANTTLPAVPGIKVGHYTLTERPTGCTVLLAEADATAGVDVRGAAPATRETDLLNPVDIVEQIHAIYGHHIRDCSPGR